MAFDDDDFTTDSATVTTLQYERHTEALRNKQRELDRQLADLDLGDRVSREDASSVASSAHAANPSAPSYPPPPHEAYGYPPPHHYNPYYPPPPPGPYPNPYARSTPPPSQPAAPSGGGNDYLVKLLQSKEEELKGLRLQLQSAQSTLQAQSVEIALLQSKAEQSKKEMETQRQLIILQTEQSFASKLAAAKQEWEMQHTAQAERTKRDMEQKHETQTQQLQKQWEQTMAAAVGAAAVQQQQQQQQPTTTTGSSTSAANANDSDGSAKTTNTPKYDKAMPLYVPSDLSLLSGTEASTPTTTNNRPWKADKDYMATMAASTSEQDYGFEKVEKSTNDKETSVDGSPWNSGASSSKETDDESDTFDTKPPFVEPHMTVRKQPFATAVDQGFKGTSDRMEPKYVTEEELEEDEPLEPSDEKSLGQTVASSTYGEDRQKVVNKSLLDPYGDKGTYTGVVLRSTGMPHGLGRMIYEEDGRIYEGDWRHGRWHGYGRATFSNGDSYEGEYKFDQRHGRGVYRWHDGRIYDGQFSEDKRHGNGVFTWPDGAVYDGAFVNGQRDGHGRYTFADGGQYDGGWKDGRYDGYGSCTWEDGRQYRGEWRAGMAHGRGTETYPNGSIRHEGQWIDDEPVR